MTEPNDPIVFLIDEDEIVRDSLKILIESHGMGVQDFRTAAKFLEESNPARVGCLVLGFNRHIVAGLDLVATLRRRGLGWPVIFIVGGGDAATKAAALAAGASAYLERPVEENALIRAITSALIPKNGNCTNTQIDPSGPASPAPPPVRPQPWDA